MTSRKAEIAQRPGVRAPRLVPLEEAACYVGHSDDSFEAEVASGTFPQPFPFAKSRRRAWDVKALEAALDRAAGLQGASDDSEERKRAWQERQREWEGGFADRIRGRAEMLRRRPAMG